MKSLAVVILNYNGIKLIKKFLPSVIKFTPIRYNIYIIDNGSSDGSVKFIRSNFKRIKIVQLNKNYGYAKGYNIGLRNINDDIFKYEGQEIINGNSCAVISSTPPAQ